MFGFSCLVERKGVLCLGGECGRGGVIFDSGYSRAQYIGSQVGVEGAIQQVLQNPKRGRSLLTIFPAINMLQRRG